MTDQPATQITRLQARIAAARAKQARTMQLAGTRLLTGQYYHYDQLQVQYKRRAYNIARLEKQLHTLQS